jgi:oligopeptide/dipeptide ABC transporter ATP-binding protein
LTAPVDQTPVLSVDGLSIVYRSGQGTTAAATDVSFRVDRGEIFGLVGETGCGKTTVLRAIIGLLHPNARVSAGAIRVAGQDVVGTSPAALQRLRGRHVAMIFQDPLRALNPVLTVEEQIGEALRFRGPISARELHQRVLETMETVGIPDAARRLRAYPHELSGGLQQRVGIAAAIIRSPELLLADEPTTALDVTIQDQILTLLRDLCRDRGMSLVLVTHDIGVVAGTCRRVGVMYAGRLIETGGVAAVLPSPSHPYTSALLGAIPRIWAPKARLQAIAGAPPDLTAPMSGCPFAARCGYVIDACRTWEPRLQPHGPEQATACLRHWELAPRMAELAS